MSKVFVSHQSPLIDEQGVQRYVSEVSIDELENYGGQLVKLIEYALRMFRRVVTENLEPFRPCLGLQGVERAACLIDRLADAVSIALRRYFVIPLTPLPLSEDVESIVPTPHDILYAWLLGRGCPGVEALLNTKLTELARMEMLERLRELVINMLKGLEDVLRPPRSEAEIEERLNLLMNLPSDTRPGCSISKLIPHLLTTAGLSVAKYLSRYVTTSLAPVARLELALLRLAALLHDIGKPRAWVETYRSGAPYSHAKASIEILEKIGLPNLLEALGIGELYEALRELVEKHHRPTELPAIHNIGSLGIAVRLRELGSILSEADRDSSNIDRLSRIFANATRDILSSYAAKHGLRVEELFTGVGAEVWNVWLSLPRDVLEKAVEKIGERIRARTLPPEALEEDYEPVGGVKLLLIDIAGIQSFIRRESLRILTSASFVIDLCTIYAIPRALIEELGISLDSIVYAGGGTVIAFVPDQVDESRIERVENRVRRLIPFSIRLNYVIENLMHSWPASMRIAIAKLSAKKNLVRSTNALPELGYEVMCEFCGRKPATTKTNGCYVCEECKALEDLGSGFYVSTKLRILRGFGYGKADELLRQVGELYGFLMNWLSGVELEKVRRKQFKIALVKIDGNAVGQYMASALNITEAMCRSMRIDMGLKLGFLNAMAELRQVLGDKFEDLAIRIYVGTLYAGGDDALAVWPSFVALPIALTIAKTFWRMNGGEVSLSIAIAAAKPKHNIWNVLEAADHMLKKCKDRYRRGLYALSPKLVAILSFIKSEWQLFEALVDQSFRTHNDLTYQPVYVAITPGISSTSICSDLGYVLNEVLDINAAHLDKIAQKLYEHAKDYERARDVVDVVHDAMRIVKEHGKDKLVLALYLARSAERASDSFSAKVYKGLAKLSLTCPNLPPLFDLYNLFELFIRR